MKTIQRKKVAASVFTVVSLLMFLVLPSISGATSFSVAQIENGSEMTLTSGNSLVHSAWNHDDHSTRNFAGGLQQQPSPTPLPPSIWLLGTGLVGLLGIKRRIRK